MTTRIIRLTALLIALLTPLAPARAGWRGGIGVLGDSYSDEYQFYPPHRSTARNWVEILAATRGLNFGRFSTQSRGEPRNQGYEYNWARSDATTDDLIVTGQHTGLAAQVARGEVNLVVVFIGGNDFINAMKTPDPAAAFQQVGPRAEANLERAVATILKAHPDVKVVIITVPDIRDLPEFRVPLHAGRLPRAYADAATATIRRYNARIRALAAREPRVAVLDFDHGYAALRADLPRIGPGRRPSDRAVRPERRPPPPLPGRCPPSRDCGPGSARRAARRDDRRQVRRRRAAAVGARSL